MVRSRSKGRAAAAPSERLRRARCPARRSMYLAASCSWVQPALYSSGAKEVRFVGGSGIGIIQKDLRRVRRTLHGNCESMYENCVCYHNSLLTVNGLDFLPFHWLWTCKNSLKTRHHPHTTALKSASLNYILISQFPLTAESHSSRTHRKFDM